MRLSLYEMLRKHYACAFCQGPHLSACSEVVHDHAVSWFGRVEFDIRLECCKNPEWDRHCRKGTLVFAFYICIHICVCSYIYVYICLCFFFIFETWRHSVADILSTSQRTADLGHIVPKLLIWNQFFLLNLLSEIIVPRLFIWNQSLKFMEALHVNSTGGLPSTVIICFESYRVEEGHVGATNHGVAHPGKEGHDCNLKWRRGQEQYKERGVPELCCFYCDTVLWYCGTVLLYCITVVL